MQFQESEPNEEVCVHDGIHVNGVDKSCTWTFQEHFFFLRMHFNILDLFSNGSEFLLTMQSRSLL